MKKLVCGVFLLVGLNVVAAQGDEDNTLSTFNNSAQALKAENLAIANVKKAQDAIDNATNEEDRIEAEKKLTIAQASLESGETVEAINEMRTSGMGWGEIANKLGIHPSVLGLGHLKRTQTEAQSRFRDMKSFSTKGPNDRGNGSDKVNNANSKSKDKSNNSNSSSNSKGGKDK